MFAETMETMREGMIEEINRREQLPSEEIKRRLIEKAELLTELESRNPRPVPVVTEAVPAPTTRITVDGRKLAGLASRAKKLEANAEAAEENAGEARAAANTARAELNTYMRETGLA